MFFTDSSKNSPSERKAELKEFYNQKNYRGLVIRKKMNLMAHVMEYSNKRIMNDEYTNTRRAALQMIVFPTLYNIIIGPILGKHYNR